MTDTEWERAGRAADFITETSGKSPKIAIVLGSGLGDLADLVSDPTIIPYSQVPGWPKSTVIGHAGRLVIGELDGHLVAVQQGRCHYYEGYPMTDVIFPPRVLRRLGVHTMVITNAAGGANPAFRPGTLMLITDHINMMGTNPMIGPNDERFGDRFFDMTESYDKRLREATRAGARELGIELGEGVYVAVTGPSYETPAEVRMLSHTGADAIGMSTVPEVIAANHCGMRVLGISCISNPAAGTTDQRLDHSEVLEAGQKVAADLSRLVRHLLPDLADEKGR